MKKYIYISLALLAFAALSVSCTKEIDAPDDVEAVNPQDGNSVSSEKQITICATLPDAVTKVTFDPAFDGSNKPTAMAHTWEDGDKLLVTDANDDSNFKEFLLVDGSGTATGVFSGDPIEATSFNVNVIPKSAPSSLDATQTQLADGSTGHLKFVASATGVTDLKNFTLTETSNIIGFIAKLPAGVAGTINKVVVDKSTDDFVTTSSLTINLGSTFDANDDGILEVYANVPSGWAIAAGTKMFLKFESTNTSHKVYTRYQEFASAATINPGEFNYIKVNCVNTDKYAGKDDDGSSAHPYLIADPYQVASINGLATGGQTTYFKMIADVDMTGVTHNSINTNSGYTQVVNFDGNGKKISKLGTNLFYVFKGSIQNLTLSGSSVGTKRGIFAEYCQGTGHTITNVDITGSSMATTSANGGAMIGRINNGSGTTLTLTDCDVTNTTVSGAAQTGGLIGSADATVVVTNCTVVKSDDGTSSVTASGSNCGGLIGQTTGDVAITDCTVSGTNVTGTGVVGGVVGFANSLVTISGSKYTGGTITASNRYVGGFLGSTKDVASTITNCQVENSTINANYDDDARGGGFVGQLQTSCQVVGCTVGTSETKVTINSKQPKRTGSGTDDNPYLYSKINVGGFVGVNYGTITKNGDVHTKAYAKITSNNTYGTPLNLGGFVGFGRGTIEYCDAIVDMTNLKGQYIGGFAGYVINAGTVIDNCIVSGAVTGNNYTGGFAGYVDSGNPVITNCTASGSVTGQSGSGGFVGQTMTGVYENCSTSATVSCSGSNNGGFAGQIQGGTLTGCSESGSVTATGGGTYGGFAGLIPNSTTLEKCSASGNVTNQYGSYNGCFVGAINSGTVLIKRCFASGNVTSDKTYASSFIANINSNNTLNVTIQNCYATGSIINSNQIRGGLIAQVGTVTSASISNCYASGAVVGSFRLGGLIGNVGSANVTVEHCAAWNSEVTASSVGSGNWSTGAIVGTAFPSCTLTDNYRKSDMPVKAFWGNVSGTPGTDGYTWELSLDYNHSNVDGSDSSTYLVVRDKSTGAFGVSTTATLSGGNYPIFPYHGKVESGKTLSQLASTTLGWSGDIWDFTGELPTLK